MSVPSTVTLAGARQAAPATDLDAVGVARPVASTPARRRRVRRTHVATGLRRLSGVGAVALFWQFAASRGWLGSLLPTPVQVWDAAVQLVRTGQLQTNVA